MVEFDPLYLSGRPGIPFVSPSVLSVYNNRGAIYDSAQYRLIHLPGPEHPTVYTATFCIIHFSSLELGFLSSPAGPGTAHGTTREVSERATWSGTDWTFYPA